MDILERCENMFECKNKVIKITKGDTARLKVSLNLASGEPYKMQTGDTLTLTVRKKPQSDVMMQIVSETNELVFPSTETKKLEVGNCCFDIELKTASSEVYTIIGLKDNQISNMVVWDEVTV